MIVACSVPGRVLSKVRWGGNASDIDVIVKMEDSQGMPSNSDLEPINRLNFFLHTLPLMDLLHAFDLLRGGQYNKRAFDIS
jgi:hypothetical protein